VLVDCRDAVRCGTIRQPGNTFGWVLQAAAGPPPGTPAVPLNARGAPAKPRSPLGRRPQPQARRPIPRTKGTTMTKPDLNPEPPGGASAQPGPLAQVPHAAGAGGQAGKLKGMQTPPHGAPRAPPVCPAQ